MPALQVFAGLRAFHGGFGNEAKELWRVLRAKAEEIRARDWRHSWTATSFSSVWLQKLSIAIANQTAVGAQRRATVCSRQRALQGANCESGDGFYESVVEGRVGSGVER